MGEANASGLYQLGNLLMNQELPWLATQVYQEAINTDEGSIEPDYSLRAIDALIARGSLDDATALVGTVKSSQLDSFSDEQELELINLEAQIALRSGDEETGAQRLQEVVSRDPLNARARLFLGDYFRDQGNKVEAEKHYEIAAEVPEFEADALVRHAQLLVEYDEFRQAVRLLNRAQTIDRRANVARYLEQVERAARSVQ
jgi:tetratricopeptide (TPR) repeat protein